jgi:hypothetical protein
MNDREKQQEDDVARLIRAGFDDAARPDPTVRQETLRRLQEIYRAECRSKQAAAQKTSIADSANRRVRQAQTNNNNNPIQERTTIMSKLLSRWGIGLSAGAVAAIILLIALAANPHAQATAAEMMSKGAQAVARLTSIHLRGQLRTAPQDNFGSINTNSDFSPIELWVQFKPQLQWRAEKAQRVAVMDGQSTLMFIKSANLAVKFPQASPSAFDTDWLHKIANVSNTLTNELKTARAKGWKLEATEQRAADGHSQTVVTIEAKSGMPDSDYLKNTFLDNADTRRVYCFNTTNELLEDVQIYLSGATGETLMFELEQIDYNQAIDPSVFQLALPDNVRWFQNELQPVSGNEKYAAMTPEQAARAYFEAFARSDWTEAENFRRDTVDDGTKQLAGGLEVISIGTNFTSQNYPGRFVPYEIKLSNGEVMKHNIALKKDGKTGRWWVDGGSF